MRIRRVSPQYQRSKHCLTDGSAPIAHREERARGGSEKVVSLVVDDDERREVAHLDLPDRLHPEFGVLEYLNLGDAVLRQPRRRPAYRAEVEAAISLACPGNGGGAVPLGQHDQRSTRSLELLDVGVHPPGGGRAK